MRPGAAWTPGVAAARTHSSAHLETFGGRLTGAGTQMAVYTRWDPGQKGYFSALAGHDLHTVRPQRRVLTGDTFN